MELVPVEEINYADSFGGLLENCYSGAVYDTLRAMVINAGIAHIGNVLQTAPGDLGRLSGCRLHHRLRL